MVVTSFLLLFVVVTLLLLTEDRHIWRRTTLFVRKEQMAEQLFKLFPHHKETQQVVGWMPNSPIIEVNAIGQGLHWKFLRSCDSTQLRVK